MKIAKNKNRIVAHETQEECKMVEYHFVGNKDLIKEIEKKAYELYESRGFVQGRDLDDWLEAEKILGAQGPR
jgi:hypothetical protein